jgi:hypothetical protein
LTQLEAAAQVHDAGHGFEPPMHGEVLVPLLPGEPATPPRLGGRQPAYAKQLAWIRAADAFHAVCNKSGSLFAHSTGETSGSSY